MVDRLEEFKKGAEYLKPDHIAIKMDQSDSGTGEIDRNAFFL
jgi:hypothetical protein